MEMQARYTLVGGFVATFLVLMVVFLIWLGNSGFSKDMLYYDIYFTGSVSGLKEGSSVSYRGIPVGTVSEMLIDPQNVERIRVTVALESSVPIKEDAFASLELLGITGGSYIQLNGGSQSSPILRTASGHRYPIITARSSRLEEVVDSVPGLLRQLSEAVASFKGFFSPENQKAAQEIFAHLKGLANELSGKTSHASLSQVTDSIFQTSQKMQVAFDEIGIAAKKVNLVLQKNEKNISDFLLLGTTSIHSFFKEGVSTFASIRRVSEQLEKSPRRFLFSNDQQQGVKLP